MIRTIRIWLLLRKLEDRCHEGEIRHPEHGNETGHSYQCAISEQDFLAKVSKGSAAKLATYADFLSLAENKMKLIVATEAKAKCSHCKEERKMKMIRLNDDGLEFVGFFDLIESVLVKYKRTWTLIVLPLVTLAIGLKWRLILSWFGL